MESSLRILRGFMILLALLCANSGWGSISCPLARQGYPIPPQTDSICLFSSGFCSPKTSTFSIHYVPEVVAQVVDVGLNHILINFCTNPLMDGARSWRGPRKKDEFFFSCFIMAPTTVGDLIIDVATATDMNFTSLMSLTWIQTNHFVNMVFITNYWFLCRQFYLCLQE